MQEPCRAKTEHENLLVHTTQTVSPVDYRQDYPKAKNDAIGCPRVPVIAKTSGSATL